ncbi:PQQ-binding-like beta-propeller repeat protein [Carboxylicivirga mesophila]|uniref:PQQ-binding-like beta-propeller repeat protein n=1 Tax=Carboxylicivirga mesophila TaxID=1166478 RepID=A0ABS5KGP5_9BACT|nr:PQQ-binding-like beta-propeller repeat protein [Carboxylicivirga mesophila]MBS2213676.1 PQQ-binding-like beta-propeller repeat protein [Carboxylicivirga mesophila]
MKKLTLLCMLVMSIAVFASKQPDWKLPIDGKPVAIFKHNFTGIPVIETSRYYYGVNYVEQSILWAVEKPYQDETVKALTDATAMVGATEAQEDESGFVEIPMTPFVNIHNKLADVGTGNILIGNPGDEFIAIIEHDIIPELYKILIKVKSINNANVLYCIDLEKRQVDWKQTLSTTEDNKNISKMVSVAMQSMFSTFAPKVTAQKEIVYKNDNDLLLINSSNGEIIWKNECKPGTFFLDNKQETLVVVKQASTAGSLTGMSASSFGKTIFALDLKNGKELWKKPVKLDNKFTMHTNFDDKHFVCAHNKGINIYNYQTGETLWKKDYETKRVQEINIKPEGVEVFYGNEIMLVDAGTGKKAWKKPIKFDDVPEDDEGDMIKKDYQKGTFIMGASFVGLFNKETGKKIWKMGVSAEAKAAFDERNTKVAILDGKKFYLFNPNTVEKKPEKIKLDIEKPEEIVGFETFDSGYFITGMNEYIMLDKNCGVMSANYFKPLKTDRLLKAALMATSVASGIGGAEWTATDSQGNTASGGVFTSRENAKQLQQTSQATYEAYSKLRQQAKLRGASRSGKDYACFLKGEKTDAGDKMSIIKVDKKSGKEVDAFNFGDNRKVIFELDNTANYLYYFDETNVNVYNLN